MCFAQEMRHRLVSPSLVFYANICIRCQVRLLLRGLLRGGGQVLQGVPLQDQREWPRGWIIIKNRGSVYTVHCNPNLCLQCAQIVSFIIGVRDGIGVVRLSRQSTFM
jgi:hypothetical protein